MSAKIITAKFSTICPCCNSRIEAGSRVSWTPGSKALHVACVGRPVAQGTAAKVSRPAPRRSSYSRGRSNGCACGARELPEGGLSDNACASCKFDEYDF